MNTMIRQGDVLLIRRDDLTLAGSPMARPVPSENGRVILARGEATGHHHSVVDDDAELIAEGERMLLRVHTPTRLEHQEHAPLPLEPGIYEVRRQRELSQQRDWRWVAD